MASVALATIKCAASWTEANTEISMADRFSSILLLPVFGNGGYKKGTACAVPEGGTTGFLDYLLRLGFSHLRATNRASSRAPAENTKSPGMRIHTSMSMIGRFMNSAERANQ